ncbi:MAG TPA: nuclear transport factor 2 family protein [Vicinamibacteria bacterium]|nr:nuclear transport factor 2 family protein [Vicinamibacteria bacterium]HRB14003.1 nuclear transport factor 2 family protein [Vicinamibacteria bacterium]
MRGVIPLLLLLGCSSFVAARDNAADQVRAHQEIKGVLSRLASAEKAGDATAAAQLYENDAMLLPSSGEPVRGRQDIAKRYQAIFAGNTPRLPLEAEEVWVLDDLAVTRGTTRAPAPRKNVKGTVRNRYVMTLKRRGDSWEIHSLVWNPATAAK